MSIPSKIEEIRALHSESELGYCNECGPSVRICAECGHDAAVIWPCETIRILDGEQA